MMLRLLSKPIRSAAVLVVLLSLIVTPGHGEDLAALLDEALANNPEILASQARWETLLNRARQAGTLDDPMLMLRAQNVLVREPLAFDRDNMSSKVIGVSQMLPFYGKRQLLRESAGLAAEASRWLIEERRLELQGMIKETWAQLYFVDRSLALTERTISVLDDLTRITEARYAVGEGLQQDVLKAQLERSRMEEMRIVLQQRRRSLEAVLNTLAYRPAGNVIAPVHELAMVTATLDAAALERAAEQRRPMLMSLDAQIDKARTGRLLADKAFFPDFTLSLEYMQREATSMGGEGDDMFSFGVTFNLPVQRERRHAMVAEAEAEARMARQELAMARNQIRLGIAEGLARLERSGKLASLYRDGIVPQASQSLAASMAAYRVGKADFMNVLDGQMRLFEVERQYYDAVAEQQVQLARLESLIGAPPLLVDVSAGKSDNLMQGSE